MRVGIITSTYPRHEADYAVPWMREGVARLRSRGVDVRIFAPSYEGLADHVLDAVPVRRFRYFPRRWERLTHEEGAPNKVDNPLFKLLAIPYLLCGARAAGQWARHNQLDLVHVHWPFPHGVFAEAVRRACGARVVAACHGAGITLASKKPWARAMLRRHLARADALTANSADTARRMRELVDREVTLLPYGTTVDVASGVRRGSDPATLLFTGRLIQRKGVEFLIEALPSILARRRVRVVITGDGDRRAGIEARVRALGLQDVVEMPGFVSRERLGELYANSDVYVLPAVHDDAGDTEGLGVPLIEAALHGMPIVACGIGGIVDVIQHDRTGLLIAEKDPGAIAQAVLAVLDDPALGERLGLAARDHARDRFDWDRIIDQQVAVYEHVLGQRSLTMCQAEGA